MLAAVDEVCVIDSSPQRRQDLTRAFPGATRTHPWRLPSRTSMRL
jgi:hypothetical protein